MAVPPELADASRRARSRYVAANNALEVKRPVLELYKYKGWIAKRPAVSLEEEGQLLDHHIGTFFQFTGLPDDRIRFWIKATLADYKLRNLADGFLLAFVAYVITEVFSNVADFHCGLGRLSAALPHSKYDCSPEKYKKLLQKEQRIEDERDAKKNYHLTDDDQVVRCSRIACFLKTFGVGFDELVHDGLNTHGSLNDSGRDGKRGGSKHRKQTLLNHALRQSLGMGLLWGFSHYSCLPEKLGAGKGGAKFPRRNHAQVTTGNVIKSVYEGRLLSDGTTLTYDKSAVAGQFMNDGKKREMMEDWIAQASEGIVGETLEDQIEIVEGTYSKMNAARYTLFKEKLFQASVCDGIKLSRQRVLELARHYVRRVKAEENRKSEGIGKFWSKTEQDIYAQRVYQDGAVIIANLSEVLPGRTAGAIRTYSTSRAGKEALLDRLARLKSDATAPTTGSPVQAATAPGSSKTASTSTAPKQSTKAHSSTNGNSKLFSGGSPSPKPTTNAGSKPLGPKHTITSYFKPGPSKRPRLQ